MRERTREALLDLAAQVAVPDRVPGKAVKTIRAADDTFHRLRVGDYRVMYDVLDDEQVLLVLGVIHRGDLERWLRNR